MASEGSILYVMLADANADPFKDQAFGRAQSQALADKLPLAVIYCLQKQPAKTWESYQKDLDQLQATETKLGKNNIPLLLLIGPKKDNLLAVFHHLKPENVYYGKSADRSINQKPIPHPYDWPGLVQKVDSLKETVRAFMFEDKNAC